MSSLIIFSIASLEVRRRPTLVDGEQSVSAVVDLPRVIGLGKQDRAFVKDASAPHHVDQHLVASPRRRDRCERARFVSFLAADLGQRELLSLRQFGGASVPSGSRIPDGGQQFCSAPS